ncbi:hypothetical protein I550_4761 [Mycobacterium intracellulare 1956]|uniref:Uncharacterized protein n=1 Tax=Mycobacterium intracellulare 1956 TaxID=1299331 RepID=X8CAI1_MYCIT|nr:hypothetical protein I548_1691 [Mycobacterium intracellulare]EUA53129.1 hypothetical protein I550_4761 [Mycobacterium intracellulare 1956]
MRIGPACPSVTKTAHVRFLVGHARRRLTQVGSPAVHTQPGQEIE